MLTAAPIIRKPMAEIGYPGMTDFVKIYIASELNKNEFRTTLRHEQAHVWAGHNRRRPKGAHDKKWKIACEMEIALLIYDEKDIQNITAPRSRLAGAYLPSSLNGLPPQITLAEDIYEWLLRQPEDDLQEINCSCGCSCEHQENDDDSSVSSTPVEIVALVREKLDSDENEKESQIAASEAYKLAKFRPPSLIEAIDATLRVRVVRERSYRRPSRRANGNMIFPGAISIPRPPLVEIFVDRSSSFSPQKTAQAEVQVYRILKKYGASIKADVWYFGNGKLSSCDLGGGGDTPYHLIAQHLHLTKPKIGIVITDDDPVSQEVRPIDGVQVICIPIGCTQTKLSASLNGKDVTR